LRQAFQGKRPQPDALQFFHRMPFGKKHAAQNILFRILQGHFIPEIFRMPASRVRLTHRADSSAGIASQSLQVAHHQAPLNFHVIHLLKIRPVFQHFGGEVAVVGQKHQAHGVVVQPSNGINALRQALQAIHQRLAPFRVGHGGHHFRRLIQHDIHAALVGFHGLTGSFDAIGVSVRFRTQLRHYLAVHAHLPAQNQLFSVTPGGDTSARDYFL
jgi:hypothetical protein